ncbi:hypothetical protein [Tolypothrix sp. PCC 7601]|uniref:hypothetical protein n=1 Tax=Tolypothrix sp. PCC 7601 TaxID=1188 RepID=UPI0021DF978B|nr:hypothetical protein [Tolypothrix sp. PCC 7601]UYD38979.1 hypothetical protein HG267_41410 [Tolypothrix sp. PCC 7601]
MENLLILPGHPDFYPILHSSLPPGWQAAGANIPIFVKSGDGSGMLKQLTEKQFQEYIEGGEYEAAEGEEIIEFDF